MTIAFGHSDKEWKSKYSFDSRAMVGFDRKLYTQQISGGKVYEHNKGPKNSFYGQVAPSVVSVAFNDNISANKVFKTISVEGSDQLKDAQYVMYPYRSTDAPSYYLPSSMRPMQSKGGMIYGGVGRSKDLINGATMHFVGRVDKCQRLANIQGTYPSEISVIPSNYLAMRVDTSGSDYVPTGDIRYGLFDRSSGKFLFGQVQKPFSDLSTYDDVPDEMYFPSYFRILSRSNLKGTVADYAMIVRSSSGVYSMLNLDYSYGNYDLYAFKDPNAHGGDLRGQRAELVMTIPASDFELYAINLNYEPVNADHTK